MKKKSGWSPGRQSRSSVVNNAVCVKSNFIAIKYEQTKKRRKLRYVEAQSVKYVCVCMYVCLFVCVCVWWGWG